MRVAKEIALWIIAVFLAYVFLKAGIDKFSSTSGWARAFHVWGYPAWFRILVGIIEAGAALLLLYPRWAAIGAIFIIVVMIGAMGTHVLVQHRPAQVTNEIFPLLLAIAVLAGRMRQWLRIGSAVDRAGSATAGGC
jgi:uncharacterized membrane protein YphA (DoxX/SURF4 family)